MEQHQFDFIIVGGGLCGCVIAARLKEAFPSKDIALVEAGADGRHDPAIENLSAAISLAKTDFRYTLDSVSQPYLNDRKIALSTGKALGGGSAVNFGGWTRGDRSGYEEWAAVVGDAQWSYAGLLPYFQRSEAFSMAHAESQHGYDGPIPVSSTDRGYPLRDAVKNALVQTGHVFNPDMNGGDSTGVAQVMETWNRGKRRYAANCYNLDGVHVVTNLCARKILIEDGKATGVSLNDSQILFARKEIIVSCGAIRTPQLLMLSGIGPRDELTEMGIPVVLESPEVGKNLHDHPFMSLWYKLRKPEIGLAIGSESFKDPKFFEGNPIDFFLTAPLQAQDTSEANVETSKRSDEVELAIVYVVSATSPNPPPVDGTHITISVCGLTPTSRGKVTLRSTNVEDYPSVDPQYLSTQHDRNMMRSGVQLMTEVMDTAAGREIVVEETPPPSFSKLTPKSLANEIDERVSYSTGTTYHYAGTAAMGKVVDTRCRVKGLSNLRIVDGSILPVSIGAHLQAPLYGVAEKAASIIVEDDVQSP